MCWQAVFKYPSSTSKNISFELKSRFVVHFVSGHSKWTAWSLTWSEVSLHVGKDGVAGRQIPDTDAHEVFAHL